jgi:Tfp pilus assembly protein PilF
MKKHFAIALFLIFLAPAAFGQTPEARESLLTRGYDCYKGGDYSCAITEFDQAIRQQPEWAKAFLLRGNAHRARKDYVRAIADYSDAIRFKADYAIAFNNRADVWFRLSDYDRALADINVAVRLRPNDTIALYNRSIAYKALGMNEEAKGDLRRVLELEPQHAYAGLSLQQIEAGEQIAAVHSQPEQREAAVVAEKESGEVIALAQSAPQTSEPQTETAESVATPLPNAISQVVTQAPVVQVATNNLPATVVAESPAKIATPQSMDSPEIKAEQSAAVRTEVVAIPEKAAKKPQEKGKFKRFFSWVFGGRKKSSAPQNSATSIIRIPTNDRHRTSRV